MKQIVLIFALLTLTVVGYSQTDTLIQSKQIAVDTNSYRIIKLDGTEILCHIISQDAREVLIKTKDNREIYIPQHTIKEIVLVEQADLDNKGRYIGEDKFATRYFITTNGLPIKKGEHYIQWNIYGPDLQFAVGENLGVGIMTSWIGTPIITTIKKSFIIGEKTQLGLGALAGTGSWTAIDWGGIVPFATASYGSRQANIAISGGYGAIWNSGDYQGRVITSIAGMIKIAPKVSLVFDSFIVLPSDPTYTTVYYYDYDPMTGNQIPGSETKDVIKNNHPGITLLIPGVRWHQSEGQAMQFGFSGVYADNSAFAIPMIQWYRIL